MQKQLEITGKQRIKRTSVYRRKEKQEFFRKYSPLSSSFSFSANTEDEDKLVLDPNGKRAYYWMFIIASAVTYYCWSTSLRVAFNIDANCKWLWLMLDAIFYIVYLLDIVVQTHTSYLNNGLLEKDVEKLKLFYIQLINFKLDLLSSLPLDWLYAITFWAYPPPLLHCIKLLKMYRVMQFHTQTESRSHYPNFCRIIFLMHNVLLIIHWNCCCYFLLSKWIGIGNDAWVYPTWNLTHNREWGYFSRQYIYCFYWSTLALTTIGELSHPQTNLEYLFMTLQYLVGILMFATLIGNIGSIMKNVRRNRTIFQNKMDNIKTYMKATKIPDNLQERVIKWFDYLWNHGDPMNDQHVLNALPDKLKAEIGIHVHFETLKKVDFFDKCEQGLLWEIVLRLRIQVYSPGELVCRKGDVGREMYIVNSGKLEVLEDENGKALKELTHGEYFGEISVLNLGLGKSQRRRTAFVRSLGYTSLLCLTQADLLEVLEDYPRTKEMLILKSKSLFKKENCNSDDENSDGVPVTLLTQDEENFQCRSYRSSLGETENLTLSTIAGQVNELTERMANIETIIRSTLMEIQNSKIEHPKLHRDTTPSLEGHDSLPDLNSGHD